jgi:hypothetical protein
LLLRNNFAQTTLNNPSEQRKSIKLSESLRDGSGDSVPGQPKIAPIGGRYRRRPSQDYPRTDTGKHIFWKPGRAIDPQRSATIEAYA